MWKTYISLTCRFFNNTWICQAHFGAETSKFIAHSIPRDGLIGCLEHFKLQKQQHQNQLEFINEQAPSRDIREAPAAFFCSARREFSAPDGAIIKNFLVSVAPNRLDYAHTHAAKGRSIISVFMLRRLTPCAAVCGVIKTQLLIKYHLCSDRLRCAAPYGGSGASLFRPATPE